MAGTDSDQILYSVFLQTAPGQSRRSVMFPASHKFSACISEAFLTDLKIYTKAFVLVPVTFTTFQGHSSAWGWIAH